MKLSEISVRRPVLASMMSATLILFGAIAFMRLSVREFPDIDPPIISVSVTLPGANPRVVESSITDILEEELATIEGIRTLTSSSQEQVANIVLEFQLTRDLEAAANDVRDKVARVRGRLPDQILEPVVAKQDSDAQPFIWMAMTGDNYTLGQLSDFADRLVKTRLQSLPGVGSAMVFGERRYAMRVWLRSADMAARGLTVQDIEAAIRTRNVEVPAGRIESERREFTVRSLGELRTPEEFEDLVVSSRDGQLVRLGDVARVELGSQNYRTVTRHNGKTSIGIGIVRQSKANLVQVSDAVEAELDPIRASLPPGVELVKAFDGADFVRASIREAMETLGLAAVLVVLIIFFFLRNLRGTVIPGMAIPTSIIAGFGLMYAFGFTINNLTLLAMILAIGIVVDDAIIVLENAFRHQEEMGKDPTTAAIDGTREIAFAVIATTVSLVAVFSPLAFLQGTTGRLFNEFGITMAGAVIVSSFVALSLTPMLCSKILRLQPKHGRLYNALERGFQGLASGYARALRFAIRRRGVVVVGALVAVALAVVTFMQLEREFVPSEDRDFFMVFTVGPEGSTLEYTDQYQREMEAILARTPEVQDYFSVVGFGESGPGSVSSGIAFIRLRDLVDRDRGVDEILAEVRPQMFMIPGVFAFAANPPAIGGGFSSGSVGFVVRHPNFDSLTVAMERLTGRARGIRGLINVDTDLRVNKPELTVEFDRNRAEDLGVAVGDVAGTLQTMLGERRVSTFTRDNKQYDVVVRLEAEERATPADMRDIQVRGRDGELVQLAAVATVEEGIGPRQLNHYDRVRAFTLSAGVVPGFALGEALDSLYAAADQVLPTGSDIALSGESRELAESGNALYFAFLLAIVVVFMVLAAQFESLVHPLTVLLAVPLAVTGALVTLLLAGSTLNLYSQIGMILLVGIVTKNSILLVEYANQLRESGKEIVDAMISAGRIRLRPILMTAVATIVGAMPIALGLGSGSASRRPLGYAIVGGLAFSTLLTLFLVPVVWIGFERLRERRARRRRERAPRPDLVPAGAAAGGGAVSLQETLPEPTHPPGFGSVPEKDGPPS
ncbi:MAG: efflux RND transporter permease subunit [Gemmatimonadetes bacterium]|nr:efflux RND transporter permease subunit [Gemmatimonadota bacterium]